MVKPGKFDHLHRNQEWSLSKIEHPTRKGLHLNKHGIKVFVMVSNIFLFEEIEIDMAEVRCDVQAKVSLKKDFRWLWN